mgnify:CR=1 FL=1|jgi:hypothetical protein
MSKTIEELAKQYAEDMCPIGDYCGGVYDEQRNSDLPIYADDAKSVLSWLFSKPLSQRLTAEEKERVRKEYWQAARDWIGIGDARVYCRTCVALESIFGADFFKEERE